LKPERGKLREHRSLARDRVGEDAVERGNAIRRHEKQVVSDLENFTHLAGADFPKGQFEG
jgi:hypothetical protein